MRGALLLLLLQASAGWTAPAKDPFELAGQAHVYVAHSEVRKPFQLGGGPNPFLPSLVVMARMVDSATMQQKLSLQDPAPYAKERIAERIRDALGLTNLSVIPEGLNGKAMDSFKQQNPSGVLIEIATQSWGLDNYRVRYQADARLINLADSAVLWSGPCPSMVENTADLKKMNPQTEEEINALEASIVADDGALIKAGLRQAAERCGAVIVRLILNARPIGASPR